MSVLPVSNVTVSRHRANSRDTQREEQNDRLHESASLVRKMSTGRRKEYARKRASSFAETWANVLDNILPRFLWAIAFLFFALGAFGSVLCGYLLMWYRNLSYNAIMPKEISDANVVMNVVLDILFGWFGWGFLVVSMVSLVWMGFALYSILPTRYVEYAAPKLRALMSKHDTKSRMGWALIVLLWTLVFRWYFKNAFLPAMGDMNMNAHGNMFSWVALPRYVTLGSNGQFLEGPDDLNAVCPPHSSGISSCEQRIEKIIHQTYKTTDLPEHWKKTPQSWRDMHPDWEYIFWTDASAREFIEREYPWFLETFDGYPNPIQRADAIRYFALYHYGGVYADMDLQPKENLGRLLSGVDIVNFETPNMGLTNMMLAARKGSRFMRCVIAQLGPRQFQAHHFVLPSRGWQILTSTGPTFWWAMSSQNMCNDGVTETFRTISAEYMGRCSLCAGDLSKCIRRGIMHHLVGSSWHKKDTNTLNFLFCQPGIFWAVIFIPARTMIALYKWKMSPKRQRAADALRETIVTDAILCVVSFIVWAITSGSRT